MSVLRWNKLGRVHVPDGSLWWARSYAAFPTVQDIGSGVLRVYFTSMDERLHGRTGWLDVQEDAPTEILAQGVEPILDIGDMGLFDDNGANAFSVVDFAGRRLMFYQGWQRSERIPYLIFTGLAIAPPGSLAFSKHGRVPILDRTEAEPFLRGAPCVVVEGGELRMWYVSSLRWTLEPEGPRYWVAIFHARSRDGVHWDVDATPCLAPASEDEYAVGRPWVVNAGGRYRMWFSVRSRSQPYRMGYAESVDGVSWDRDDTRQAFARSADGFDSEMVCYPSVHYRRGRILMFYNGNSHGKTGFGVAEARVDW